mgnify:CR=1 FL=1|jgi:tetratricopeptide (TPR) repeat protein
MDLSSEKREASVAWFRLAELVDRGEKEKALNLYRLLSHSFEDRAYALQVEGDILWSFEDKEALEKYKQSAFLYRKEQKLAAAISIYEHLFTVEPDSKDVLRHLVEFYIQIDWMDKVEDRFSVVAQLHKDEKITFDQTWYIISSMLDVALEAESLKESTVENLLKLIKQKIPAAAEKAKQYTVVR